MTVAVKEGVIVTGRIVGVTVDASVGGMDDGVDVISGGVLGFGMKTNAAIIRRIIPIKVGMTYF